jgi:hypothetical protein
MANYKVSSHAIALRGPNTIHSSTLPNEKHFILSIGPANRCKRGVCSKPTNALFDKVTRSRKSRVCMEFEIKSIKGAIQVYIGSDPWNNPNL